MRLALVIAVAVAFPAVSPAAAQMVCGERKSIIEQIEKKYGETLRSLGLQQGRGVVEIYASSRTGSWSILMTNTRGQTCLMAAGDAFEAIAEEIPAEAL